MKMFLLELMPYEHFSPFRGEPGTQTAQSFISLKYLELTGMWKYCQISIKRRGKRILEGLLMKAIFLRLI